MNWMSYSVAAAAAEAFGQRGPVVEYGAYRDTINETAGVPDLRTLYNDVSYTGYDLNEGPGVDHIGDVTRPRHDDESVGTWICLETLEHLPVPDFDGVFSPLPRILAPGGVAVLSTLFSFKLHGTDQYVDRWRFSPECLGYLMREMPFRLWGGQGRRSLPQMVFAVGMKQDNPEISRDTFFRQAALFFDRMSDLLDQAACKQLPRNPVSRFLRRLKYDHVRHLTDLHMTAQAGSAVVEHHRGK